MMPNMASFSPPSLMRPVFQPPEHVFHSKGSEMSYPCGNDECYRLLLITRTHTCHSGIERVIMPMIFINNDDGESPSPGHR